jgi:hypothetical protein
MRTINDKPFVTLDPFINIDGLKDIPDEIALGLARNHHKLLPGLIGTPTASHPTLDPDVLTFFQGGQLVENNPEYHQIINELKSNSDRAFLTWIELKFGLCDNVAGYYFMRKHKAGNMPPRPVDALIDDESTNDQYRWDTNVEQNFPKLFKWINDLDLKVIGTVVLIYLKSNSWLGPHNDLLSQHSYDPVTNSYTEYPHKEEFIWVNPSQTRQLSVFSNDQTVEYSGDGHYTLFWNNHDYHGSKSMNQRANVTIRIDCVFGDKLRNQLGLDNVESY